MARSTATSATAARTLVVVCLVMALAFAIVAAVLATKSEVFLACVFTFLAVAEVALATYYRRVITQAAARGL